MVYNILFGNYNVIQKILLLVAFVFSVIFAISLHEVSHGYAAYKMGDPTAKVQGRLTLNPLSHFEPVGLLMFVLIGFGFARPVPVNPYNFKNLRKGMLLVAFAGVLANLAQTLLAFGLMVGFGYAFYTYTAGSAFVWYLLYFLYNFAVFACLINAVLIAFNLLPFYPLDGFRVVECLTPANNGYVRFMRRYGQYILIAIVLIGFMFERLSIPEGNVFGMYLSTVQKGILDLFNKIMEAIL